MSYYKALISKRGEILSLLEEGPDSDNASADIAAGSKYPDVIFVNADNIGEAEGKVKELLRKAEREYREEQELIARQEAAKSPETKAKEASERQALNDARIKADLEWLTKYIENENIINEKPIREIESNMREQFLQIREDFPAPINTLVNAVDYITNIQSYMEKQVAKCPQCNAMDNIAVVAAQMGGRVVFSATGAFIVGSSTVGVGAFIGVQGATYIYDNTISDGVANFVIEMRGISYKLPK